MIGALLALTILGTEPTVTAAEIVHISRAMAQEGGGDTAQGPAPADVQGEDRATVPMSEVVQPIARAAEPRTWPVCMLQDGTIVGCSAPNAPLSYDLLKAALVERKPKQARHLLEIGIEAVAGKTLDWFSTGVALAVNPNAREGNQTKLFGLWPTAATGEIRLGTGMAIIGIQGLGLMAVDRWMSDGAAIWASRVLTVAWGIVGANNLRIADQYHPVTAKAPRRVFRVQFSFSIGGHR